MRRITDHTIAEGGFGENIRGLVRNSPWWMSSGVIHLLALFVLAQIPVHLRDTSTGPKIQAQRPPEQQELERTEFVPPDPPKRTETIVEEVPVEDEVEEVEVQDGEIESVEVEGDPEKPYVGPQQGAWIGLLGGAGGGGYGYRKKGRNKVKVHGSVDTRDVVHHGLKWLADHQDLDTDGRWDCDDFMKHDPPDDRCDGPGGALYDVGVTGLALLAFLGAGYTERKTGDNPYSMNVLEGLRYLMTVQDEEGCFGARSAEHFIYNHAIATLAICEAYAMTRNPILKKPAQDGLDFIAHARNPYLAWRYEPRGGENDTSVTGWMIMALKSGKYAGLDIDPDAFEGARQWIEKMTDPEFGQAGYNMCGGGSARPEGLQSKSPPEKTRAMTAVAMLTRIFLGEDPRSSEMIRRGADLCLERLPRWNPDDGSIDMYYWYYGSLALFQVGGTYWKKWQRAMIEAVVESQNHQRSGSRAGSWDPIGAWGGDGGRVYATACLVMCLEVFYRYDRVFPGGLSVENR